MTVTYYHHSGFSVALDDVLLIFDYWLGEQKELPEDKRITPEFLSHFKEIYVFISHEHPDHMDPVVYEWRKDFPITYIVADDMPVGTRGKHIKKGDEMRLTSRVSVKAFDSTDLGVSFLVDVCGIKVFHAGDLNFWHWREESTVKEIEEADEAFRKAVEPITHEAIDVAFFPVDPRQGRLFDAGANYFILSVKPRLLIPMHFWGRAEIAVKFARQSRCRETEVVAMTRFGEQIRLEFEQSGYLTIHLLDKPETIPAPKMAEDESDAGQTVDLEGYEGHDPFNDTDLPVKFDE